MIWTQLAIAALYVVSFLYIWCLAGYALFMGAVSLRLRAEKWDRSFLCFVSIIVPTHNESAVIRQRITNLLELDYPDDLYEILVVDSGSTDGTAETVRKMRNEAGVRTPAVRLVTEGARNGKAAAINFAKKYAKGEVVLVTDANSTYARDVLKEIIPCFKDATIGAVSGRYRILETEGALPVSESFYWDVEHIKFIGESGIDSLAGVIGGISAWRKELVDFSAGVLAEDLDMCIKIRKRGFKIKYVPQAVVYEPAATSARDQVMQRKRIGTGIIQSVVAHLKYFLRSWNVYSRFIFPSHRILPAFSPFLLLAIPALYIAVRDSGVVLTHFIASITAFTITLGLFLLVRSKLMYNSENGRGLTLRVLPRVTYYVLLNEYIVLVAWFDFLFKRYSVLWPKATTTRISDDT